MKSWWARRWMKIFRSVGLSNRFSRGRAYAEEGRVVSIEVRKGLVTAAVQGSRENPYSVEIRVDPLSETQWEKVTKIFESEARFLADILSGRISREVQDILTREGVFIFPKSPKEIQVYCTCPDWASPCKHIAAVYYTLMDLLDDDPSIMFRLRGKRVEELMAEIRRKRLGRKLDELYENGSYLGELCGANATHASSPARGSISLEEEVPDSFLNENDEGSESAVYRRLFKEFFRYYEIFWKKGPQDASSRESVDCRNAPMGIIAPLPPLPFRDKDSIGRRKLEEVYELASRRVGEEVRKNSQRATPKCVVDSYKGCATFFLNEKNGWILIDYGGVSGSHTASLFRTEDGGKTWNKIASVDFNNRKTAELPFGGIKIGVSFRDEANGWLPLFIGASGGLVVLNRKDGGKTWIRQVLAVPKELELMTFWSHPPVFFNDKDGVLPVRAAARNFVIYHSTDGGKTWASTTPLTDLSPYPVYDFIDPQHGFVTDGSKVYQTSDGGVTWSAVRPNVSLKGVDQVDFVSFAVGWALVGDDNNAQLYRTQNGEETWSPMLKTP